MLTGELKKVVESGVKLTPMMAQYIEIKANHPDALLMFRMGDFYELFFDDARQAAKILNIALTHRGKLGDTKIPMAGIPHHAAATYIDRFTSAGLKAAICEQVEDPKDAKGIVKRAVTQVVSPGIPFDFEKSSQLENNFIACGWRDKSVYYLTLIDFTTGKFLGLCLNDQNEFIDKLSSYRPKELITFKNQWTKDTAISEYLKHQQILQTYLDEGYFQIKGNEIYIEKMISNYKRDQVLKNNRHILNTISALGFYITTTQGTDELCHIRPFKLESMDGKLKVGIHTLRGLEIFPRQGHNNEEYKDSLLGFMDRTQSSMGSRALRYLFLNPYTQNDEINSRLSIVQFFKDDLELLEKTRKDLSEVRDLERILAKISTSRVNSSDLINLARTLNIFFTVANSLKKAPPLQVETLKKGQCVQLEDIISTIVKTINDEMGASLDKGNLIKPGAHKKRDRLAKIGKNATAEVDQLEEKYRKKTGIQKLKVKFNNVNGYFVEVSKLHAEKLSKQFERIQTLVNSERFITSELNDFEKEVLSAKEKLENLEKEIFQDIVGQVAACSQLILTVSNYLAAVDVFCSLAWVAEQNSFSRPTIENKNKIFHVEQGWHPLIKANLGEQFINHDLILNEQCYFGLITGPNMAGKTTVMREMAIIQFLAQIGSYVPAQKAQLSLCDFIFSRLGASDDIIKGQSTFMVEMTETAEILRHSSERSLIILDEVGRGTSTYDGLSIAWALVEHLIEQTKAFTLFSTHYHELIDVVEDLPGAKNLTVETRSNGQDVQFLYRLIEQGAAQSFGIYVAKLAGLPRTVLHRSQEILNGLEEGHAHTTPQEPTNMKKNEVQLSFFDMEPTLPDHLQKLESEIYNLDVLNMTPIEALIKLKDLKENHLH